MKKVNRKFLEEQVKLALTEQEQEQQTGCVPVNEDPGFWSWQMLFSLFFGSPESYKIIAKDLGRKYTWGSSAGSQYLEAASFAKLKSPEKYIFRFLEPVKAGEFGYVGSVKFREEIFESFYKVIKFYAQKFSKVNLKAKGTTLGFGEESLEQLVEEFIEKVEEVEERYGLDDPEAGGWAFLKVIGVNVDTEAANAGRHLQTTKAGLENKAKNMRKFLSTPRSVPEIEKYLEGLVMQGIGDIYFGPKIRSFVDIYNYVRSNQKGGKLLNMINAATYQKKIKETPTFAAYADVIGSLALLVTTGGAASAGTKAEVKVGARGALARGIAKAAQVTGMPRKAALALIGGLEKRILAKVESSILQTAAKVSTGSAKLATKVAFALPRFLAETSMTMGLVTDKMNFQLGKYQKLFVQYENLIKNQKIDKDALPSDSDTIEVFSMLGDTVKAAVASGEEGEKETQDNSQKIEDKKQFLILKAKLEKDLLETFDAIETASYAEFGGLLKECGVQYAGLVEEEKEIRRNIIIDSFKQNPPNLEAHRKFIADVSALTEELEYSYSQLKKKTQELQSKTSELNQGLSDLGRIKNNIGIEKPSFISSDESQATQAATTQAPTIDTPTDVAEPQTSFGSNEKTSDEILRDLETALSKIQESQDPDTIYVNVGYKDAIEFAKGNKDFSPEKTKANIDKMVALVKSKGKEINITPVAAMASAPKDIDKNKFDDFSKFINSYIQTKDVSTAKPTQTTQTPTPADKPTSDREVAQGKDVSNVSGPEILIIGDSTSNNIVDSNKILQRGKKESRKVGYYGKDGTMYDPKDFGGNHNKALAAAKAAGGGVVFPGWSEHASHGGAGTTYIKNSLVSLLARDESYVPKVAIISMGYNDPPSVSRKGTSINNFKSIISALKERGVKDIRIIEPRADKGSYKRNADLIRPGVYDLADSVVKIVPNPTTQDGGPTRHDGVHYTAAGAQRLFKDAMSGLTVSKDAAPQTQAQAVKPASVPSKATSEGVPYSLVTSKLGITRAQYDLYRTTLGQRESGQRYNIKGGAGGKYDGFYQMGSLAKIDSGIKLPSGASDWNSEVARKYFRENPAVQEEAFGKMTAKNMDYLNDPGKHTEKWEQLKQNPATKLGIMAVAHLLGHGGAKKFINNNLKNAGQDAFGTKDSEYYSLIKNAIAGGDGGVFASGAADQDTTGSTKPGESNSISSADLVALAKEIDSYETLASFVYRILDTQASNLRGKEGELQVTSDMADRTDLSSYKKIADDYLKSLHKRELPVIKNEFFREIEAAKGDKEKMELANKKIAYFHRPIFFSKVNTMRIGNIPESSVSFGFEPGRNRASVNFGGSTSFYKQDHQNGSELKKFTDAMNNIRESLGVLLDKLSEFRDTEPDKINGINIYSNNLGELKKILDKTIPVIADDGETALRRSYATYILNRALIVL